jgi:uncharacterized cysteine cluster protein YcgN (CxxCxxCC family)
VSAHRHKTEDSGDNNIEAKVRELITDWLQSKCAFASERSGDIYDEWKRIITDGKKWCKELGIKWEDTMVPEHIRDSLAFQKELDQDGD